ncbi:MAG: maleylpyruvate isomerase family mycothiol-dependent enzyme [Marmoricola sp.]
MTPSENHRRRAEAFGALVAGVTDWSAPAPVKGWDARDVVMHLIDWPAALLAGAGIELDPVPVDVDQAWQAHQARIQSLMDDESDRIVTGTPMGPTPLGRLLDQIYVGDIFLHSWDLARASGQEPPLDEETCAAMLAGMAPIEDLMRGSGQYGARVPVAPDRSVMDQLMGFIGRDPDWRP